MRISFSILSLNLLVSSAMYGLSPDEYLSGKKKFFDQEVKIQEKEDRLPPELVESVLRSAPKRIIELIKTLKKTQFQRRNPQKLILEGPPGTGKTTLAEVIAQESGRDYTWIEAHAIKDKYQNSGSVNLQAAFKPVLENRNPQVVVIDEITRLVDQHEDKNNPEEGTGMTLWKMLDECSRRKNILIIGTTNDFDKMPKQLKSRFGSRRLKIDLPDEKKRFSLLKFLCQEEEDIKFSLDINDQFLRDLSKGTDKMSIRGIEELVEESIYRAINRSEDDVDVVVKKEDFIKVLSELGHNRWMISVEAENFINFLKKNEECQKAKDAFLMEIGRETAVLVFKFVAESIWPGSTNGLEK